MEGQYQPVILDDFSGGWVTNKDQESDSLRPNESPSLSNVEFSGKGSFAIRKGFELFGDRDNAAGSITTSWTFRRPIRNDSIAVRQHYDNTNYTLQYYNTLSATWENITITGTMDRKLGYANYTSSNDSYDYMYFSDGTISLQRWTGGNTILNGALSGGEATITVDSTAGFLDPAVTLNANESIDVAGTTVTYTGLTGTTFTGCSGTPAAADNAPIEQASDNFSASSGTKPKGNILEIFNSQLAVAGDSANPQYVTISDVDDFTDWGSGLADSQATNGSQAFTGGVITGLKAKDDTLVVFTEDVVAGLNYEFKNDLTGFQIRKENIEETSGYGAKVFTGVTRADNVIFYVGNDNIIRKLVRSPVSALFDTGSISENIRNTLADYTMTNAAAAFYKNKLYFAVQSDQSNINDVVLVFDLKYARNNPSGEAWTKYDNIFASSFFLLDGALHFGSSASPNSFRLFEDSNGDDILTDDGNAIVWSYDTPQLDFGLPHLKKRIRKVVHRGFISANGEVTYGALYDYGTTSTQDIQLLGTNETYVFQPVVLGLGEEVLGEQVLGAADPDPFDGASPFVYPTEYGPNDFYVAQFNISGSTSQEKYRQTRLVVYIEAQDDVLTN